jgi:hypothetical protein
VIHWSKLEEKVSRKPSQRLAINFNPPLAQGDFCFEANVAQLSSCAFGVQYKIGEAKNHLTFL